MISVRSYLRTIRRFAAISFILIRQYLLPLPYRLLLVVRPRREGSVSRYLKPPEQRATAPEIAKETLEKLGPTFVKFGQFLSIRPDLVPPEYSSEFSKLQDKVPPFRFALVQREVKKELKGDINQFFSEFDETPVAAASISQVHRARLRTGEEVAVKVQRPGIREDMVSDIMIMLFLARLLERCAPSLRKNQPVMLIREFSRWTDRELYFRQEGKNALHFSHNFRDYPCVRFPKVHRAYTTRKILVMEYLRGVNILHAPPDSIDRKAVAGLIADSMMKQIFIDGFFHGDPHAGNILLLENGTIAYLDFGIVGYLSEELRAWIFDILYGMSTGDVSRVIASFLELCNVPERERDLAGYRREMHEVLSELPVYESAGIPFSQMMERFLNTSLEFGIRIPHDFVLVSKAITTFEGTCLSLDPEIRIVDHLRRFVQKHITAPPHGDDVLKQLLAVPFETARLKRLVLKHGGNLFRFLEQPTVRLARDAADTRSDERAGMNIVYGLLMAALIIFAAVIGGESGLERWLRSLFALPDLPVLPLAGLTCAGVLGLAMALRNRRARRGRQ